MIGKDGQRHRHLGGRRVFANVGQRFLHKPVNRQLGRGYQLKFGHRQTNRDGQRLAHVMTQVFQRNLEPQVRQ